MIIIKLFSGHPLSTSMNDPLAVIYNEGYWRVHEVSPMINLQYSKIYLKQYATVIRQTLESEVPAIYHKLMVTIENLPLLKYSDEDPTGLMITIKNLFKPNDKEVYVAIFLSWGYSLNIDNETTHLPYMLERGEKNVGSAVKNTMQTLFDCIITAINFTQVQLLDFMFNYIENDTSRSSNLLVLSYQSPQVNFKDKVTLSFELGDIRTIWNRIKESNIDQDRRLYAYQVLQNQICHMFTLDVTLLRLCEVVLPKAEVKYSGMVKMKTPEIINSVFTSLNEITRGRYQLESSIQDDGED